MTDDPWDYAHITCWNFLPFVLQRVGEAPAWVVRMTFGIWFAVLAALAATLIRIRNVAQSLDQSLIVMALPTIRHRHNTIP